MAIHNPVCRAAVRACRDCGKPITFASNRNGKPFAVNVLTSRAGLYYESGIGAYGNLTPWHQCPERNPALIAAREQREQEARLNDIARPFAERANAALVAGDIDRVKEIMVEYRQALAAAGLTPEEPS